MGLAPQIVEEIFEIVQDLNAKEGVSFLLAEQNTMVALRYANYGYILENGRVVMDGAAQRSRAATRTSRSSTSACRRRAQELPRRQALPPPQALAGLIADAVLATRAARWHVDYAVADSAHVTSVRRRCHASARCRCRGRARSSRRASGARLASPVLARLVRAGVRAARDEPTSSSTTLRNDAIAAKLRERDRHAGRAPTARRSIRATRQVATRRCARVRASLAGVDAHAVTSRAALARLPVTRKSDLLELQKARPPVRRACRDPLGRQRAACSRRPGPIYEPEGRQPDYWRLARALFAAGFRAGDLVHNCFSYHFTPAGSMLETGAHALGCTVFPGRHRPDRAAGAGDGRPEARRLRRHAVVPEDHPREGRRAAASRCRRSRKALVSGEAFPPSLRDALARARHRRLPGLRDGGSGRRSPTNRARARDSSSTRACWSRSCARAPAIRSRAGEVGEVVVTALSNADYPLIRFGTGDLSALLPGARPCGRTNMRIKGWMGRADQTTKVKGMFVHPSQVAAIVRRHPEIVQARLVVDNPDGNDRMTLHVEVAGNASSHAGRDRRVDPRGHQAARRSGVPRAGRAAERRQGDRRHPQVRLILRERHASAAQCERARGRACDGSARRVLALPWRTTPPGNQCRKPLPTALAAAPGDAARDRDDRRRPPVSRSTTILINEGDVGDSLYIILSGRVKVYASNEAGTRSRASISTAPANTSARCRSTARRARRR